MKRKIVQIDENKCNGCGLCVTACHEGAIELIDGKARLISDTYCDGLGACLPACPVDAINIIEREAAAFDEEAVAERMAQAAGGHVPAPQPHAHPHGMQGGCPSAAARTLPMGCPSMKARTLSPGVKPAQPKSADAPAPVSGLGNWPVQLRLIHPAAPYLQNADLLIAADCVAYAYAGFHSEFAAGRVVIIGCPKLDDTDEMLEKLIAILSTNDINSVTCLRMEVPCCGGITSAMRRALVQSGSDAAYREVIVGIEGELR